MKLLSSEKFEKDENKHNNLNKNKKEENPFEIKNNNNYLEENIGNNQNGNVEENEVENENEMDNREDAFNFTEGGEGIIGFKHSEETRKKMSDALSGENNPTYITNDGYTIWTDKEINYSERFEEYEVELRKESGNANAGFGIVFAGVESEGKSKMMVVLINKNQYYLVGNVTDGIFQVSQDWNFTNRLRASTNVNRLKVTYNESTKKFSLYINETAEPEAVFSSAYNFTAKNSRRGFAAVISPGDNFPQTPVKVVYTIK